MAVLARKELKEHLEDGEILDEDSIDDENIESHVNGAHILLTIDRNENKISNVIYSENIESNRDDLVIKKHRVPQAPEDKFKIPPREIAILTTEEKLNMPPDLVGRVGIRLSASQCGLIPLFGPQVDPGYKDKFYAVIYNASDKEYNLSQNDGKLLKLEVRELTSEVDEEHLEDDRRDRIPQPFTADTSTPDLSDVREKIDNQIEQMDNQMVRVENEISNNRKKVHEVEKGYTQVVLFGIFLLATATFGAMLPPILETTSEVSIGQNAPTAALIVFIGSWLAAAALIIWHSLKTMRAEESQISTRSGDLAQISERFEEMEQEIENLDESSTEQ